MQSAILKIVNLVAVGVIVQEEEALFPLLTARPGVGAVLIFAGVTIAPAPSTTQLALATVEVRVKIKKILDTNRRKYMIFMLKKRHSNP